MTFDEAKAIADRLESEWKVASDAVLAIYKPQGWLTPDHIRARPDWQEAKAASAAAFQRLRIFNGMFVKMFAKEIRDDRDARRVAKLNAARETLAKLME